MLQNEYFLCLRSTLKILNWVSRTLVSNIEILSLKLYKPLKPKLLFSFKQISKKYFKNATYSVMGDFKVHHIVYIIILSKSTLPIY